MKICVVGGGPGGMTAALSAAENGAEVTLVEQNEKLGKKLYITGKGRCNLTNDCPPQEFLSNVVTNNKFLFGAINALTPEKTIALFGELGLKTKTERGKRVFPVSDKASDVTKALERGLVSHGVEILLGKKVTKINFSGNRILSLNTMSDIVFFDKLILASGGVSYPSTGSDGSVFGILRGMGHTVTKLYPSLVEIKIKEKYPLEGLSLTNVNFSVFDAAGKRVFCEFGEMLFTRGGVSGPLVLTASAFINKLHVNGMKLAVDLKPALSEHQLDCRILRDFGENSNKQFKNSLSSLLPQRLISVIIGMTQIDPDKKVNQIMAEERAALVGAVKSFRLTADVLGGIEGAVVTSGGVDTKEINPKTMQSRLFENLYFAGEMIDVDALTGGFNMQTAFSTGYLAGMSTAKD